MKTITLHLLLLTIMLVGALAPLGLVPGPDRIPGVSFNLPPELVRMADEAPDARVRVIVHVSGSGASARELVASLGGEIIHELALLNAFAANLKAGELKNLLDDASVTRISLDAPVRAADDSTGAGYVTLRADFDRVDYSGRWTGWYADWIELGESDGPQVGQVVIESFWGGIYQGVRLLGSGSGIRTEVNLSHARLAVLSLAFRRKDFTDLDRVVLEASTDGVQWQQLDQFTGPAADAELILRQYDLAGFGKKTVQLRWVSELGEGARFYLDFVQVDYIAVAKDETYLNHLVHLPMIVTYHNEVSINSSLGTNGTEAKDSSGTLRDDFNLPVYDNNDGSINWAGSWLETDQAGIGPSSGNIAIMPAEEGGSELRLAHQQASTLPPAIERPADLTFGVTGAVLTFSFRTDNVLPKVDKIAVLVSGDNGLTYTPIEVFAALEGSTSGTRRYDISAYTKDITRIKFQVQSGYTAGTFYVDEVQVAYTTLGADTVRDEFHLNRYTGQDGLALWKGPWKEYDPYGGNNAAGGYISVVDERLQFHYLWNENIHRRVDLRSASRATLSFEWETSGLDKGENLSVYVLGENGTPVKLAEYTGNKSGTASLNLSPYISARTVIGFESSGEYWESGEYAYIDNIQISYITPCPDCIDTSRLESAFILAVEANELWNERDVYLQGQGVTVAVVDSGVAEHANFSNGAGGSRILAHVNYASTEDLPDDFYGHGTHVAGLIASDGFTSDYVHMGMAPGANLVDVKVLDDLGRGYTSDVVAGLEWVYNNAAAYGIRVVNLSLNSAVEDDYRYNALTAALELLWMRGITVIVAAGNNQDDPTAGLVFPPANDPYLVVVGASDDHDTGGRSDDTLAVFSASGTTTAGHSRPDLIAPGTNMISLKAGDDSNLVINHPDHIVTSPNGNQYFRMSGTSMAAPVVAGAAALLLQAQPELRPDQVKATLVENSLAFLDPDGLPYGNGAPYLNVPAAVANPVYDAPQQGYIPNDLLAKMALIAFWVSIYGEDGLDGGLADIGGIDWADVDWSQVDWNAVDWSSVDWSSIDWSSIDWGSVNWGSVNWGSVNWGSVNWGSDHWEPIP